MSLCQLPLTHSLPNQYEDPTGPGDLAVVKVGLSLWGSHCSGEDSQCTSKCRVCTLESTLGKMFRTDCCRPMELSAEVPTF